MTNSGRVALSSLAKTIRAFEKFAPVNANDQRDAERDARARPQSDERATDEHTAAERATESPRSSRVEPTGGQ